MHAWVMVVVVVVVVQALFCLLRRHTYGRECLCLIA
jgi:hypothetical protein